MFEQLICATAATGMILKDVCEEVLSSCINAILSNECFSRTATVVLGQDSVVASFPTTSRVIGSEEYLNRYSWIVVIAGHKVAVDLEETAAISRSSDIDSQ